MCTVSFVPVGDKTIVTSNRDEKIIRPAALLPQKIETSNGLLFYPVDAKAGGTWFIANDRGDVGVLLNGAYQKHVTKERYRKSRGSILPALFTADNILEALDDFDFVGIENCTLVLFVDGELTECIWDGENATLTKLDETGRYIWSSVTLYNEEMIAARREWFKEFITENSNPSQEEMIHFHTNTGKGNDEYGLKMNRDNAILTVSITSIAVSEEASQLKYIDCLQDLNTIHTIENKVTSKQYD